MMSSTKFAPPLARSFLDRCGLLYPPTPEKRRPTTRPRQLRRAKHPAENRKWIRACTTNRNRASTNASYPQAHSRAASSRRRIGQRRLAHPLQMISQLLICRARVLDLVRVHERDPTISNSPKVLTLVGHIGATRLFCASAHSVACYDFSQCSPGARRASRCSSCESLSG